MTTASDAAVSGAGVDLAQVPLPGPGGRAGGPAADLKDPDGLVGNWRLVRPLNRVGLDGWELTSQEEQRDITEGHTYWDATWSLTTYTFKRRVA